MSIERLLDQIRVRFDTQTARAVVSAFRAEPLAWHYLKIHPTWNNGCRLLLMTSPAGSLSCSRFSLSTKPCPNRI